MVEHFNIWFWGTGGYEFMGGMIEIFLPVILVAIFAAFMAER